MADKNTIGLTLPNDKLVEQLIEAGVFKHDLDAAKYALSVAFSQNIAIGDAQAVGTKWNVGSFDRDNQLRDLIILFFPGSKEPYRVIEFFVNAGLEIIAKKLKEKPGLDVRNLLDAAGVRDSVDAGGASKGQT